MQFMRGLSVFLGGALLALTFEPFNLPAFLVFFSFLPLLHVLHKLQKREFVHGFIFGLGFFLVLLKWLSVVGIDAVIALSIICSIWWGISTNLSKLFITSRYWPLWFAFTFTAFELARDRFPFGGFGWGQLGISLVDTPISGLYGLIGQIGVTFLMYLLLAVFYRLAISQISWSRQILTTAVLVFGLVALSRAPLNNFFIKSSNDHSLKIVAIQGGVERTGLGTLGTPRAVLTKHIAMTEQNLSTVNNSNLVIWPESSVDLDPYQDSLTLKMLNDLDKNIVPPVLIGSTVHNTDGYRVNSSQLLHDGSLITIYEKRRLVPFGEFLPFREVFEKYTNRAALLSKDFYPGSTDGNLEVSEISLGILICFEVADDSLIHAGINDKSATLVQTNNATYQNLGQSEQQLTYARMRAIETGKPLISIATSGISAAIDSDGSLIQTISQNSTGIITITIDEKIGSSIASKTHVIMKISILLGFFGGLVLATYRRFRVSL